MLATLNTDILSRYLVPSLFFFHLSFSFIHVFSSSSPLHLYLFFSLILFLIFFCTLSSVCSSLSLFFATILTEKKNAFKLQPGRFFHSSYFANTIRQVNRFVISFLRRTPASGCKSLMWMKFLGY